MDETISFLNLFQQTFRTVKLFLQNRRPGRIFQVGTSAVREAHQILVILIASASQYGIQNIQIHLFQHSFQQILGHTSVVDHTQRLTTLPALHSFRNLLQGSGTQVIVDFHFSIAGKLKRVCLEIRIAESLEHKRKAAADHVFQIHQIALSVCIRQTDETSAQGNRNLQISIVRCRFFTLTHHLYGQIDAFIGFAVQQFHGREPYGYKRTAQFFPIKLLNECQLFGSHFSIIHQINIFLAQRLRHTGNRFFIVFHITRIQFSDLTDQLAGMFAFFGCRLVRTFGNTALGSHTHTEKLIQVIGINTQKSHTLQQGYMRAGGFLQNTSVEVHPTDISLQIGSIFFLLNHFFLFFRKIRKILLHSYFQRGKISK